MLANNEERRGSSGSALAAGIVLLFALGACSDEPRAYAEEPSLGDTSAVEALPPLPTETELEEQVAEEITEENADSAFEDLKQEIEGGR